VLSDSSFVRHLHGKRQLTSNVNLTVLLAGGGFKHASHLAFDTQHNYPLPNLYVSMLQRLGFEIDRIAPAPTSCAVLIRPKRDARRKL
jgi:hypothetical protein